MKISRREFVVGTSAALASGLRSPPEGDRLAGVRSRKVRPHSKVRGAGAENRFT
jgi:hypothetical protein